MLKTIWNGNLPKSDFLLLWEKNGSNLVSHWYKNIKSLETAAKKLSQTSDCYIGVGASPQDYGPKKRCLKSQITAIPALVADLDLENPTRKKEGLFKTRDQIFNFISSLPLAPTVVLDSGGGIQCWWAFHEPFMLNTKGDRKSIEGLAYGWSHFLDSKTEFTIDYMWDVSRVMRIPGTLNHKTDPPTKVTLISEESRYYDPEEFREWCTVFTAPTVAKPNVELELPDIDDAIDPPFDKFQTLYSLDAKFKATWERKRPDMGDPSPSEYDLSLASIAALNHWKPEEIQALLISHRRKHGDDLKRKDYYIRTIDRAFDFKSSEEVAKQVDEAPEELDRAKIVSMIRSKTGVQLERIIKHGDQNGVYSAVIEDEPDRLIGNVQTLLKWGTWHGLAFETGGRMVPRPKPASWAEVLRGIQQIVEIDDSEEVREMNIVKGWVKNHVDLAPELTNSTKEDKGRHYETGQPFSDNGNVYFRLPTLLEEVKMSKRRGITDAELLRLLKVSGFVSVKKQSWTGNKNVSKRYWTIGKEELLQ